MCTWGAGTQNNPLPLVRQCGGAPRGAEGLQSFLPVFHTGLRASSTDCADLEFASSSSATRGPGLPTRCGRCRWWRGGGALCAHGHLPEGGERPPGRPEDLLRSSHL